ncbi:hypothetical protein KC338_g198 [Hortaea werneckii]|nr:hypothetical protein KC338_g198 [Hortaea werneckii]
MTNLRKRLDLMLATDHHTTGDDHTVVHSRGIDWRLGRPHAPEDNKDHTRRTLATPCAPTPSEEGGESWVVNFSSMRRDVTLDAMPQKQSSRYKADLDLVQNSMSSGKRSS